MKHKAELFKTTFSLDAAALEALKYLVANTPCCDESCGVRLSVKESASNLGWRKTTPYVKEDQEEGVIGDGT